MPCVDSTLCVVFCPGGRSPCVGCRPREDTEQDQHLPGHVRNRDHSTAARRTPGHGGPGTSSGRCRLFEDCILWDAFLLFDHGNEILMNGHGSWSVSAYRLACGRLVPQPVCIQGAGRLKQGNSRNGCDHAASSQS